MIPIGRSRLKEDHSPVVRRMTIEGDDGVDEVPGTLIFIDVYPKLPVFHVIWDRRRVRWSVGRGRTRRERRGAAKKGQRHTDNRASAPS